MGIVAPLLIFPKHMKTFCRSVYSLDPVSQKRWESSGTWFGVVLLALLMVIPWPGQAAEKILHLFIWDDYLDPDLVEQFEKAHDCTVEIEVFDSNESLHAKFTTGSTGYDVIVPTAYMVTILNREGYLAPLDHSKLLNLSHMDKVICDELSNDKEFKVSVPYMAAPTCIGYSSKVVKDLQPSWSAFDRTDLKGRMTLLDDPRETIGAALKLLGFSANTTDEAQLNAAGDVVIRWKKNIAKFDNDQYNSGIASGEFVLCHGYSGDLYQAQEENKNVSIVVPKEGTLVSLDFLCIPKAAPSPDLAHAFINFLCEPAVAAKNAEFNRYLPPNKDAYPLMSDELRSDKIIMMDASIRKNWEVIDDLGAATEKYSKVWDRIKAAP